MITAAGAEAVAATGGARSSAHPAGGPVAAARPSRVAGKASPGAARACPGAERGSLGVGRGLLAAVEEGAPWVGEEGGVVVVLRAAVERAPVGAAAEGEQEGGAGARARALRGQR